MVYDPDRDLAVLYVPGPHAPVMPFATKQAETNADAIVLGLSARRPVQRAVRPHPRRHRNITGPDIYDDGKVTREIYTIRALVRSGNSGGPLVAPDGSVLGVIFAAAADDQNTGFAITADEAAVVAEAGKTHNDPTGTGSAPDGA